MHLYDIKYTVFSCVFFFFLGFLFFILLLLFLYIKKPMQPDSRGMCIWQQANRQLTMYNSVIAHPEHGIHI